MKKMDRKRVVHVPLHCIGTPVLHTRGSEIARVRLKGSEIGTFPVITRHPHSTLSVMRDFTELQQSSVGEDLPFPLLPVM